MNQRLPNTPGLPNKLSITVVGTGYVGLVTGACFAELGFNVTCLDKDQCKIEEIKKGHIPIYEPLLSTLVEKNIANNRLHFDTTLKYALESSDIIFIAVGTPTHPTTGEADLCFVENVAEELAPWLTHHKTIIVKSTVPVGTGQRIKKIILSKNPQAQFSMVSNPEFLREGSAVYDFMNPDRIIVGSENSDSRNLMNYLYQSFITQDIPIVHSNIETAEMIKYAANCFLATKIGFVNEVASLCEKLKADVENVMLGVGLDKRIGSGYLKPGPGYGGSCFPKDTLALCYAAEQAGSPLNIIEAVVHSNEMRKKEMITKIISACGGSVQNKKIAILGLAFKANTDDVRDSAAITIIQGLQAQGAQIKAYDPQAMEKASQFLNDIFWAKDAYKAIEGSSAVVIVTEWPEFANLDLVRARRIMKNSENTDNFTNSAKGANSTNNFTNSSQGAISTNAVEPKAPVLIDLRNLYAPETVTQAGLCYASIGRPFAIPDFINSLKILELIKNLDNLEKLDIPMVETSMHVS